MFDFHVEQLIDLGYFSKLTGLNLQSQQGLKEFIEANFLFQLKVFSEEDEEKNEWREKGLEVLDDHQVARTLGSKDEQKCIYYNSLQGRKLNFGIENSLDTHNILLFVASKETLYFNLVLKDLDCDFVLFKFEAPFDQFKSDSTAN